MEDGSRGGIEAARTKLGAAEVRVDGLKRRQNPELRNFLGAGLGQREETRMTPHCLALEGGLRG